MRQMRELGGNCSDGGKLQPSQQSPVVAVNADFFNRWLSLKMANIGKHVLLIFTERPSSCDDIIDELREVIKGHYVSPEVTAKRLAELGAPATAEFIREHLPITKKARSGDLGEILATELTERKLGFNVPVRRLRYKDGREMALRGDDIVAVARDPKGRLKFLKGESKSRSKLTPNVVKEASVALDRDYGRPNRNSVLFVAERLSERGEDDLARDLEKALLHSFRKNSVDHLLFTVSSNDPDRQLSNHLSKCTNKMRRHAVGVCIINHGKFINQLFSGL
jgi:hypothetical protein